MQATGYDFLKNKSSGIQRHSLFFSYLISATNSVQLRSGTTQRIPFVAPDAVADSIARVSTRPRLARKSARYCYCYLTGRKNKVFDAKMANEHVGFQELISITTTHSKSVKGSGYIFANI